MWHNSFPRVTWLIHLSDTTHTNEWHDSFVHELWLIGMCDATRVTCSISRARLEYQQEIIFNLWENQILTLLYEQGEYNCVCICACVCVSTYKYVHILHLHMNITLYIYIQIYVYICGCESISMYSYIYLHFCMWMYTCTHLCVHRHKSTLTAACERTNAHMRLINTCDSFIHMTWLIHMSDMTHSDARISHAKHHPLSHKWVTYSDLPGQAGLRTRATMSRMNRYHTWMVASHGTYVWVTYEWMIYIIYVSSRDYVTYE